MGESFNESKSDSPAPVSFLAEAGHSAISTAQDLFNGVTQNANHIGIGHVVGKLDLIDKPEPTNKLSEWTGQVVGAAAVTGLAYLGFRSGLKGAANLIEHSGAVSKFESTAWGFETSVKLAKTSQYLAERPVLTSIAKNSATGFAFGALTSNVDTSSDSAFWSKRLGNGAIDAATFAVMGGLSKGISETGRGLNVAGYHNVAALLRNPYGNTTVGGAIAGGVHAEGDAFINKGRAATPEELARGIGTYALSGLTMAAVAKPFEPKLLEMPMESGKTFRSGSLQQRLTEGGQIQREVNKFGDTLDYTLPAVARRADVKVIAVGEKHLPYESELRDAVTVALPAMNKAGVKIIAEELPPGTQKYLDAYMQSGDFGFGRFGADPTNLPFMLNVSQNRSIVQQMATARGLGMRVVAVDAESGSTLSRDQVVANNISKLGSDNPGQKTLWISGNFHTETGSAAFGQGETAASLLKSHYGDKAVVTFGSMTNSEGTLDNLGPSLNYVHKPLAVPTSPTHVLKELPAYTANLAAGHDTKLGRWDYLTLLPRRVVGFQQETPVESNTRRAE